MNRKILLMVILLMVIPAQATTITTRAASGITADTVTFNATYASVPSGGVQVWFEYGMRNDFYMYSTPKTTLPASGDYTYIQTGYPLISSTSGEVFYYRGMSADASGNQLSFTLTGTVAIDDYNFDAHIQELKDAKLNVSKTVTVLPKPYEDIVGTLFYGIVFGLIFMVIWIRQDDVTNPAILGIIISAGIFALVPPDYLKIGNALLVVSIAGIIISIIFKK